MRLLLLLIVVGLIWEEDACWQLKEAAWVKMQNYQTGLVF